MLLLLLFAHAPDANSAGLAWASPVRNIVVDGDLSDWPEMTSYAIANVQLGDDLTDADDLRASFRVGFDDSASALYVAVDVQDESTVGDPVGGWDDQDICEIFVDFARGAIGTASVRHSIYPFTEGTAQYLVAYGASGELEDAEIAMLPSPGGRRYEWRLNLKEMRDRFKDLPMEYVGFDVALSDRDEDGSFSWVTWERDSVRNIAARRQGVLILLEPPIDLGGTLDTIGRMHGQRLERITADTRSAASYQMFFTGVLLSVAVLHLLLFLFRFQRSVNLSYALYASSIAIAVFLGFGFQLEMSLVPIDIQSFLPLMGATALLIGVFGLSFLYSLFYGRLPGQYWFILVAMLLSVVVITYSVLDSSPFGFVFTGIVSLCTGLAIQLETLRVIIVSIIRKRDGARIVGTGYLVFVVTVWIALASESAYFDPNILFGVLVPILSVSIYLARNVARSSRQLEERNRQIEEATRNKSQFLRRMSHDLRSPMNAIIGYSRLLRRKLADRLDERESRNLQNIETSSGNLLNLINGILDLSRIEAGRVELNPQPTDVRALANECADALESIVKPGVELRRELSDIGQITIDPDRLRQVVMNLLGNAAKFTDNGHITLSLANNNGTTELTVTDTGIGIPPDDLPHIFDEFRRVERQGGEQSEGTGLGLAIAKKTVELLGGEITADSAVGEGTTFTVCLSSPKGR